MNSDREGRERDGLETIIPEVNPAEPGDRFVMMRDRHDPVTCRNGDHYGQCSGATAAAYGPSFGSAI